MTLVRWQPMYELGRHELNTLSREMNRLLDQLTVPAWDSPDVATMGTPVGKADWVPAVEVQEHETEIVLRAELPGLTAADLDIQVTRNAVSLAGERRQETNVEAKPGTYHSEIRYGRFQRIVPLRVKVESEQVKANYTDGVLTLTLPKAEDERRKVFKVNLTGAPTDTNGAGA
jgi:HSP20 family protein